MISTDEYIILRLPEDAAVIVVDEAIIMNHGCCMLTA